MAPNSLPCFRPILLGISCLAPAFLRAADSSADQTVVLSPFEVQVERDTGYLAADTLSAGRLATSVLVNPADLSVLTRDFLDDIAATNLTDAYRWLPGVNVNDAPTGNGDNRDYGLTLTVRGLPSGGNSRNYIGNFFTSVNQYIVDRLELVRGPNSILYGVSLSGGLVNIVTKRAEFHDFASATVRTDTHGSLVGMADLNAVINPKLAVRVNAVDQRLKTWVDGYHDNLRAADLALTFRPWKGGELRVDAEDSYKQRSNTADPEGNFTDNVSSWGGKFVTAPTTTSPGAGITIFTSDFLAVSAATGNTVVNMKGLGVTFGSGLPLGNGNPDNLTSLPQLPKRDFSTQPTNYDQGTHSASGQLFFDQTWDSGLAVEYGESYMYARRRGYFQPLFFNSKVDVNQFLANGAANPNFGQIYSDQSISGFGHELQNDLTSRINAIYPVKTSWFTQTFALMGQDDISHFNRLKNEYSRLNNGNPSSGINLVNFRQYWNDPRAPIQLPTTDAAGDTFGWTPSGGMHQFQKLESVQFGTVGTYLNNTLTFVGGVRHDSYAFYEQDEVLSTTGPGIASWTPHPYGAASNTATFGLTYFPEKYVGLYTDFSSGFNPNGIISPFLPGYDPQPIAKSHVDTGGIRLNLWNGKLVGSIGYYKSVEAYHVVAESLGNVDLIWQALGLTQNDPLGGASSFSDTLNDSAHGWEADLTANVTNHFRLKANAAIPRTSQTSALPAAKAYLAANLSQWSAAAPTNSTVAQNLATFQNNINSTVDGRAINGTFRWMGNLFGEYTFGAGWLKALTVGGGANFYGPRLIGNVAGLPFDFMYAQNYTTLTANARYTWKIAKLPVTLQINVSNLLDYSRAIPYNVIAAAAGTGAATGTFPGNFDYLQPTTATFSLSVRY